MRLLVISAWYPNRVFPADGLFVQNMARLVRGDAEVTVLAVVADPKMAGDFPEVVDGLEEGLRVVRVYYRGGAARVQRVWARGGAWRTGLKVVGRNFDLIHAHVLVDGGIAAQRFSAKLRVPYVVTEHSSRWLKEWPLLRIQELWLARRAAGGAALIMPVTEQLRGAMEAKGVRGRFRVVSNSVDGHYFYPPAVVKGSTFRFLHISDFGAGKRVDVLVAAFFRLEARFPGIRLHLAGDGDRSSLIPLVRALDLRQRPLNRSHPVTTSGPHRPEEIGDLMRTSDCFVLTSEYETQSIVILESLLCGLPVVATRCGGPQSILTDEQLGTLIPINDIDALAGALQDRYQRGKRAVTERAAVAERARERYEAEAIRQQLLAAYNDALNA